MAITDRINNVTTQMYIFYETDTATLGRDRLYDGFPSCAFRPVLFRTSER